jgi:hypothetical protein
MGRRETCKDGVSFRFWASQKIRRFSVIPNERSAQRGYESQADYDPRFLDEFRQQHLRMNDRSFCFILGAGASVQSGILTGAQLVQQWLQELHVREHFGRMPLDRWATAQNLDEAERLYRKALALDPNHAINARNFANFMKTIRK